MIPIQCSSDDDWIGGFGLSARSSEEVEVEVISVDGGLRPLVAHSEWQKEITACSRTIIFAISRSCAIDFLRESNTTYMPTISIMNEQSRTGGYLASNPPQQQQRWSALWSVPWSKKDKTSTTRRRRQQAKQTNQARWQLHGQMHKVEYSRSLSVPHLISFPVVFNREQAADHHPSSIHSFILRPAAERK